MSRTPKPDLYATLGVPRTATLEEIKAAFRDLAKEHHPDRGGEAERFRQAQEAYEALSDPERRRLYDEGGDWDGSRRRAKKTAEDIYTGFAEGAVLATAEEIHYRARKGVHETIAGFQAEALSRRHRADRLLRTASSFPKESGIRASLVARAAELEREIERYREQEADAEDVLACLEADVPAARHEGRGRYFLAGGLASS